MVKLKPKKRVYKGRKIDSKELESYIMLHPDTYQSELYTTGSKLCIEKTRIYMKKKTLCYKEQDPVKVEEYKNEIKDITSSKIVYIDDLYS